MRKLQSNLRTSRLHTARRPAGKTECMGHIRKKMGTALQNLVVAYEIKWSTAERVLEAGGGLLIGLLRRQLV